MYSRKKKLYPFLPTSVNQGFGDVADLFPTKDELKMPELTLDSFKDSMVDAETGEAIVISKAGWNVREGRLNLNTKTILEMGTGRLDIKNKVENVSNANNSIATLTPSVNKNSGRLSPIYSTEQSAKSNFSNKKQDSFNNTANGTPNAVVNYSNIRTDSRQDEYTYRSRTSSLLSSSANSANPSRKNSYQPDTSVNVVSFRTVLHTPQTPNAVNYTYNHLNNSFNTKRSDITFPGGNSNNPSILGAASRAATVAPTRHPLLTQYLKEGPLSPMHHR
jgi:hypothetical protein